MSSQPRPEIDLSVSCACGRVTVHAAGTVRSMFMCTCEDCQKATGTGHSTVAILRADDVTITGPVRTFERPANSGATFIRSFCDVCGTPISGRSSRASTLLMLPVGLFGAATGWFAPNQIIFARSHRDWDLVDSSLPQHQTYRDEGRPA